MPTILPHLSRTHHEPTEVEAHRFMVEASTLDLPPGLYPPTMTTDLGNGQPLLIHSRLPCGGRRYRQSLGCIVVDVIND